MADWANRVVRLCAAAIAALALAARPAQAQVVADPLVPLDHPLAPFLESRAYAAAAGASAEFRKIEWVALDTINRQVYWAMSEVAETMSDALGDVQVAENPCGIVYAGAYDDAFNVAEIAPLIVGGPYDPANVGNECALDNIANPDNLAVDAQGRLWIGEDSDYHANNVLWMYDGALHRFATLPAGAEVTGLLITADNTLFLNVQHPGSGNPYPFNRGVIGVVNHFDVTDDFTDVTVPTGDAQGRVQLAAGDYQVLGRVGALIPEDFAAARFGVIRRADGALDTLCNQPDANVFAPAVADGSEGYLYTNFECDPAALTQLYIRRTGALWDVVEGQAVDFAPVQGAWKLCGGNLTPWGSALVGEEDEPIASRADWKGAVSRLTRYFSTQVNPYDYGYMVEIQPDATGENIAPSVRKLYVLGRFSHENALLMPDGRTLYFGDDSSENVFFKFVADAANDLSAGTLYAAKATQQGDAFALAWIELGHSDNATLAAFIDDLDLPD